MAQTIETLEQKLTELESKLNALQQKLPFEDMSVMTLTATEENMTARTGEYGTIYLPRIKIDNPICNNNPKAIVLAVNQSEADHLQPVNVVYDGTDGYWYLTTPQFRILGFTPGLHITDVTSIGELKGEILETHDIMTSSGVPTVGPQRPRPGERYSVIIFSELPVPMTNIVVPDESIPAVVIPDEVVPAPQVVINAIPVSGEWQYRMVSSGGSVFTGQVFLVESETRITGNFMTTDNTHTRITGTFVNGVISISRDTGLQTTQQCELNWVERNRFSGTYINKGRLADSGTVEFLR